MRIVRKGEVWEWLRDSEGYKDLFENEDEIEIEDENYSKTSEVDTFEQFVSVYKTIGFWGINKIPESIYDFYRDNKHQVLKYLYDINNAESKLMVEYLSGYHFDVSAELNEHCVDVSIYIDINYIGDIRIYNEHDYNDDIFTPEFESEFMLKYDPKELPYKRGEEYLDYIDFFKCYNYVFDFIIINERISNFIESIKEKRGSSIFICNDNGHFNKAITIDCYRLRYGIFKPGFDYVDPMMDLDIDNINEKCFIEMFKNIITEFLHILRITLNNIITDIKENTSKGKHQIIFEFSREDLINEINLFSKQLNEINWNPEFFNFDVFFDTIINIFDKNQLK